MRILATAAHGGSAQAIANVIKALKEDGHELTVYAAGSAAAAGFGDVDNTHIGEDSHDYSTLLGGHHLLLTGLAGHWTPEGAFIREAEKKGFPSVGVLDTNAGHKLRLGEDPNHFPTTLAVMSDACIDSIAEELGGDVGAEAARRCKVVGWTAFDDYAKLRAEFTPDDRARVLQQASLDPGRQWYIHFTSNIPANAPYFDGISTAERDERKIRYGYECNITRVVVEHAKAQGLPLAVKPHPQEHSGATYDYVRGKGFHALPPESCDTKELILAASAVSATRSSVLDESCLLDRDTGAFFPNLPKKDYTEFASVTAGAIPYALRLDQVRPVIDIITTSHAETIDALAEHRKRFSVDGNASRRLATFIQEQYGP